MHKLTMLIMTILLVMAGMGFAACTVSDPRAGTASETLVVEPSVTAPASVTHKAIQIRWFVPQGDGTSEKKIAEEWNALQDAIELVVEIGPGGSASAEALWRQIDAGDPPDIVGMIGPRDANKFPGLWQSMDDLVAERGEIDDFEPAALEAWRVEGELIGVPVAVYPTVLFYNRDLFDAAELPYPPHTYGEHYTGGDTWTVEKMQEIGMQLALDVDGRNALEPDFDSERMAQWGLIWGGDLRAKLVFFGPGAVVTGDGKAKIPAHWREAVHWYYDDMWEKHYVTNEKTTELWTWNPFDAGVVAMGLDPLWYLFCCAKNTNWDIAAVPSYGGVSTARLEHDMIGVLRTTTHPREAAEAAYAISSNLELNMAWGGFPARKSLQAEFLNWLDQQYPGVDWQVALDSVAYADVPSFDAPLPNYFAAWDRMEDFVALLESKDGLDIDAEIETLEADLQAILDEGASWP